MKKLFVFWLTQLQPKRRAEASKTLVKISYFYSLSGLKKQILDKKNQETSCYFEIQHSKKRFSFKQMRLK